MRFFLCIEVLQKPYGIFICQRKYAMEVRKRFGMQNSNPIVLEFKACRDDNGITLDETY